MAVRILPEKADTMVDDRHRALGSLYFGDGSQKMLAAMTAWLGLLSLWEDTPDAVSAPAVRSMIASFLAISTCLKGSVDNGNSLQAAISRIVKQNVDAKVLPVSSFQWCSILRSLGGDVKLDDALLLYNSHPNVVAHDESGSGSITLDNRKKQGVQNWFERTCHAALGVVLESTHDMAFSAGCFGEGFSLCNFAFLGSAANLLPSDATDLNMCPLDREVFVVVEPCLRVYLKTWLLGDFCNIGHGCCAAVSWLGLAAGDDPRCAGAFLLTGEGAVREMHPGHPGEPEEEVPADRRGAHEGEEHCRPFPAVLPLCHDSGWRGGGFLEVGFH